MVERLLFHTLKNLPRRDSFLKHSKVSDYLPEFKSNQNHNTFVMWEWAEKGNQADWHRLPSYVQQTVRSVFGAAEPGFMLSGILLGRFMGVSWESRLGGGESLLLMGCVTLVSSRSAWSGVINDWQQSALTGFISVPVLSLNASNLQRVLLGFNSIQRLTMHLCVPPLTHHCTNTDTLKVGQGHFLQLDRRACHLLGCFWVCCVRV